MFLVIIFTLSDAHSAPIPGTSSSEFVQSEAGLFRSKHKFTIHANRTQWELSSSEDDSPYLEALFLAPDQGHPVQASLSVRVDQLARKISLKTYMKRWIKDYPRLGFDILSAQKVRVNQQVGFLLDLTNRDNDRQLRQVVFLKERTAVILTCRDHRMTFKQTVKSCNHIIRNFSWM